MVVSCTMPSMGGCCGHLHGYFSMSSSNAYGASSSKFFISLGLRLWKFVRATCWLLVRSPNIYVRPVPLDVSCSTTCCYDMGIFILPKERTTRLRPMSVWKFATIPKKDGATMGILAHWWPFQCVGPYHLQEGNWCSPRCLSSPLAKHERLQYLGMHLLQPSLWRVLYQFQPIPPHPF